MRVRGKYDPGSPLFLLITDSRSLHLKISDGLWLRFVDLEAALAGRTYHGDDSVVIEVADAFCPWNDGRWRVGANVERTDDDAELELDSADLASAYLGAFDFNALAIAERVRELEPGALERATISFARHGLRTVRRTSDGRSKSAQSKTSPSSRAASSRSASTSAWSRPRSACSASPTR